MPILNSYRPHRTIVPWQCFGYSKTSNIFHSQNINGGRIAELGYDKAIWKGNRCGCPNLGKCCLLGICVSSYAEFVKNFIERKRCIAPWYGNPNLENCGACPWPPPYSIQFTNRVRRIDNCA